jgi:hypothetical protein
VYPEGGKRESMDLRDKIHNILHEHWELENSRVTIYLCVPRLWYAPWLVNTEKIEGLAEVKETLETHLYKFRSVEDVTTTLDAWSEKETQ